MPSPATNGRLPDSALAPIAQGRLRLDAARAWNAMNVEARKLGLELVPTGSMSSYRTYQQQVGLYALYRRGGNLAALPGSSNHGWGLAVDVPTQQMRQMIDRIGEKYGWAKKWSDAQSEWWHIKWKPGKYLAVPARDVGPSGTNVPTPKPPTPYPGGTVMIHAVVKQSGAIEVFVEDKNGTVWHTWQTAANSGWAGAEKGKNATWYSLGTPGK